MPVRLVINIEDCTIKNCEAKHIFHHTLFNLSATIKFLDSNISVVIGLKIIDKMCQLCLKSHWTFCQPALKTQGTDELLLAIPRLRRKPNFTKKEILLSEFAYMLTYSGDELAICETRVVIQFGFQLLVYLYLLNRFQIQTLQ